MLPQLSLQTVLLAVATGAVPTVLWLWFWLKEDAARPEPRGLEAMVFVAGALVVMVALPIEQWMQRTFADNVWLVVMLSAVEELGKYLVVYLVAFKTRFLDEPIDYLIYLVTGALGFAALENTLFLLEPFAGGNIGLALTTGNLRFLGATLLHTATAALLGIIMGMAYYKSKRAQLQYWLLGIAAAIALHSLFNLSIIQGTARGIIMTLGLLWIASIAIMFLFERLRRLQPNP